MQGCVCPQELIEYPVIQHHVNRRSKAYLGGAQYELGVLIRHPYFERNTIAAWQRMLWLMLQSAQI